MDDLNRRRMAEGGGGGVRAEEKPFRPGRWSPDYLKQVLDQIEADAIACEREAAELKVKKDELNSCLMATQAMAHRLDIQRIKTAFAINA